MFFIVSYSELIHCCLGPLPAVESLSLRVEDSIISINWTTPFVPVIYPEVSYCVNVMLVNSNTLHSNCDINQTEFVYTMPPNISCDTISITVTPVNSLGTGPSSTITNRKAITSIDVNSAIFSITKSIFVMVSQVNT